MASFSENIAKIRGQAVYGPEMRTAIADALMQALGLDIDGFVFFILNPMIGSEEDFELEIVNSITSGS